MSKRTRRTFLKQSALAIGAGGAFTIAGTKSSARVLGANDRVRIGIAGLNGRGSSHVGEFGGMKDVEIAYLIDPDTRTYAARLKQVASLSGDTPTTVQDVREALDDKNLDAISVATPNHWHSLMTIWGCRAGKDVYVEKPCSHNIHEGRIAVETARHYNRIVQHGTQQRSNLARAKEIAAVQSGEYGKLLVSKGYCAKPRWSIDFQKPENPPAELDFNLWLGPAPKQPFHRNLVHYNWHWFWDTGNGDIGNQGVHEMDVARWAIKGATLPRRVWSLGGRYGYEDQGQTPNTQMTVFDYGETLMIFEVRGLVDDKGTLSKDPRKVTNEYYCEAGMIHESKFYPKEGGKPQPLIDAGGHVGDGGNFGNFISAVRSRRSEDLNADILVGHYSAAHCHLANISYRLGAEEKFAKAKKKVGDDNEFVAATFDALRKNLTKGVGLKLKDLRCQVGPTLDFDAETERFVGNDRANAMLTRAYREPFVVPDKVV